MVIRFMRFFRSLPRFAKKQYKRSIFKKYAVFGMGLDVDHTSMCYADHSGLISIGNDCRIYGTLAS